jgi:hypothetical protein
MLSGGPTVTPVEELAPLAIAGRDPAPHETPLKGAAEAPPPKPRAKRKPKAVAPEAESDGANASASPE